jgi:hypothetical protein
MTDAEITGPQPLGEKITRAKLLALPFHKTWSEVKVYNSLYIVPTGKKHDSGYGLIAIIGVLDQDPRLAEIAAYCDDICWCFPLKHPYDRDGRHVNVIRTDCLWPSQIIRIWASGEHYFRGRFRVGVSLSSTEVELVIEDRKS